VLPEPNTTLQSIGEQQWSVGTRYKLEKVLGYGSNSTVCLAHDTQTSEKVALKRIGNVLQSPESAKRVLREVCILRRLSHPNIIALKDCFVRPSATGECRLLNGKLVCMSVDLYIAMECGAGDLFHLKGQLSSQEVQNLLWQIVQSVNYLHSLHVWHRDVKSSNFLFKWENGERIVKLGDFGSARFADPDGYEIAEQPRPLVTTTNSSSSSGQHEAAGCKSRMEHKDSFEADINGLRPMDIYAQPGNVHNGGNDSTNITCHRHHHYRYHGDQDNSNSSSSEATITSSTSEGQNGAGAGYKAPLTCVVTTPCYRAPEVVMSRGGYTSAIDVWSIGCIFGELLQREAHVGSATTPNLQVAPLFAMMGKPLTPAPGESFDHPENDTTRRELAALFDVIGTPCWSDLESIQSPQWREYLKRMPGKASRLYRRLGAAGEAAVDLLRRMLEFEPHRRCSCEEALAHEYFESYVIDADDDEGLKDGGGDAVMTTAAAPVAEAAADAVVIETKGEEEEVKIPTSTTSPKRKHALARYCEEPNPGKALAMLEEELSKISHQLELSVASPNNDNNSASTAVSVANAGCQRLRELLEAECTAIAASSAAVSCYNTIATTTKTKTSTAIGGGQSGRRKKAKGVDAITGLLGGPGLQLDTSADRVVGQIRTEEGERDLGRERLANVADTWRVGKQLDPSKYLPLGRHGEWTDHGLGRKDKHSQPWGVSVGDANMDPKMAEVIRKQQAR